MSKNRNYQSYYNHPEIKQPENAVIKVTTEESPKEEVAAETEETKPTEDVAFETEVTPTEVIQKSAAIVKGAPKVNMRSAPSKDATVITVIPENTSVLIVGDSNEYWYLIEFNGTLGYMMSKYLKRI